MVLKENQINLKISNEEKEILEKGAKYNYETLSSFLRRCALMKSKAILKNQERDTKND